MLYLRIPSYLCTPLDQGVISPYLLFRVYISGSFFPGSEPESCDHSFRSSDLFSAAPARSMRYFCAHKGAQQNKIVCFLGSSNLFLETPVRIEQYFCPEGVPAKSFDFFVEEGDS